MKKQTVQKPNKTSYEEIGRMVENIYLSGYLDRNQMYKMSFIKGVITGLGGVIGATIVVGLLLWILSLFDTLPLIDQLTDKLERTVQSQK